MTNAMSDRIPAVTRGTFLRSAAILAGAGAGAGLGAGALTAAEAAPAAPARGSSDLFPRAWRGTAMDTRFVGPSHGYIASFGTLYELGPITSLSAAKIKQLPEIIGFTKYGTYTQDEQLKATVTGTARLDGAPATVLLTGRKGLRIAARAYLVRTADPRHRAVLLYVLGAKKQSFVLPKGVAFVVGRPDTHRSFSQVHGAEASRTMLNAIALSFAEEGTSHLRAGEFVVINGGRNLAGRARGTVNGHRVDSCWYGTAVPIDGGWGYLMAKRPR